jgi:hypothetical protein
MRATPQEREQRAHLGVKHIEAPICQCQAGQLLRGNENRTPHANPEKKNELRVVKT